MSYENACDVICVHEDKVNNALSFLEDDKSKKLLNILEKICDEKKLKIILSLIKEDELRRERPRHRVGPCPGPVGAARLLHRRRQGGSPTRARGDAPRRPRVPGRGRPAPDGAAGGLRR
ncbi:hypothetical protein ACQKI0_11305, partial [Staphylococcus hominis]